MTTPHAGRVHPDQALFDGEKAVPFIPACEHFAGSEKLMRKALMLQLEMGPVFDITCDCEDGAATGSEAEHVRMVARLIASDDNQHRQMGVRIHDPQSPHWRDDVDALVGGAGDRVAYITVPKSLGVDDARRVIDYIRERAIRERTGREIPMHLLVETHGALADAKAMAALPNLQVLDFGLMDFISAHQGALGFSAMRSPLQFEHPLVVRAKTEVVAAALAHGVVPAHNVSLNLKDTKATFDDASRARHQFGFLRMWSIYPAQIAAIVQAMRPADAEVQQAEAILLAAQAAHWGPISHEGDLHDRATYRYFWNVLRQAHAQGSALGADARAAFFS
ncbi:aldolase/citrate lyase family protein [uncultured Hydrogenophaga sp.]|uniref:HpcH/HpaI aldolase/citrate lyase family protein n=1 Tax=uncultured Hydrogenophaga sp. TaxID=199683 RepID=UPI00258A56AB|nr:aldolase/citrate lyase family protein [uncultured Hydrogenophaga sp.]